MLTYRLACELADRITAIAPVAGAVNVDGCRPSRPIAALVIHGTADQAVPYNGGPPTRSIPGAGNWENRSVQYAITLLTTLDRCPATPSESREGAVVRTDYAPCADGLEVVLYTVEGGGHAWPGGEKPRDAADDPPPQPDASAVMLEFFARYSLDR
jgi:polyhydroxybutyrate depolymerase